MKITEYPSYQQYLYSTHNVHARSETDPQKEYYTNRATKLGAQGATDHEIAASSRNYSVSSDSTHRHRGQECLGDVVTCSIILSWKYGEIY